MKDVKASVCLTGKSSVYTLNEVKVEWDLKVKLTGFILCFLILLFIFEAPYAASSMKRSITAPHDNNGEKWRIGYCESEPFVNYAGMLNGLIKGLNELGWINNIDGMDYKEGQQDTSKMWEWLSSKDMGSNIEFVKDAYYSLSTMDEDSKSRMLGRLQKNDLDLMIVMGTYAGKFTADNNHNTPVMVFVSSNAVQSGIIKSETDSGSDNVWAHMDSGKFQRQIRVFYDIFKFKKLGIVYENSPLAKEYSAIDDVESIAGQKGFEIVYNYVNEPKFPGDEERYHREVSEAYKQLSEKVDAMYITIASLDSKKLPELFTPFYEKRIPVFSQLGADEVMNGALMSISTGDFKNLGRFGADNIARLFNGAGLRSLQQVFESTPQIIINLEVADKIGYDVPFEVLLTSDKIYKKVGDSDGTGY